MHDDRNDRDVSVSRSALAGEVRVVADGVTRIPLPMDGNPLGWVNAYLVDDEGGATLIDCGWKAGDVMEALERGLASVGRSLRDIARVAITHVHYDHYGLAGTLRRAGVPALGMHRADWDAAVFLLRDPAATDAASDRWLARHGFHGVADPDDEATHFARNELTEPTFFIEDGAYVGRLTAFWTPGHSPGHLCFLDRSTGQLFSGDHVLNPITPHVGAWFDTGEDRLGAYVASVERMRDVPARGVLPAHGEPFDDLCGRANELLVHHHHREDAILEALDVPRSATDVAHILPWTRRERSFDALGGWHQAFAVAETIAHLEHLRARGRVERQALHEGIVYETSGGFPR